MCELLKPPKALWVTDLVQYRRHHIVINHTLIRRRGKDFVKGICLVAQCIWSHGQFEAFPLDSFGVEHHTTILSHFTFISSSTTNDDIDIRLLIVFKIAFLALCARCRC